MKVTLTMLLLTTALAGCGAPPPDPAATPAPPAAPAAPADTALLRAIEEPQNKARSVEQTLEDEQKRRQAEIDAQGG